MIVKIHSERNRQLEHKRKSHRVPLHSSTDKGEVSQKKTWPFIPCRLPPPPLVVASDTVTGTILAFVGGWFKFKLGYLKINILLRHTIPGNLNFTPKLCQCLWGTS
ncbi:hypothetical protein MTP99_005986 [Tenebrio molitor]|nr:hypothetical protein MTP99_005986 [Tenebrio molitor]